MSDFDGGASQLDLRQLLADLKKTCGLWFLTERSQQGSSVADSSSASLEAYVLGAVLEIMQHGLRFLAELKSRQPIENAHTTPEDALKKLNDDFEWVRRSAQIRDSLAEPADTSSASGGAASLPYTASSVSPSKPQSIEQFLRSWLLRNLRSNCLCACLQVLVADRELLECYYAQGAFLRNEAYSTALFICLSAVELNQYSLLSQIEADLYSTRMTTSTTTDGGTSTKHRRTSSHPIFSISPPKRPSMLTQKSMPADAQRGKRGVSMVDAKDELNLTTSTPLRHGLSKGVPTFRKTKSLPTLENEFTSFEDSQMSTTQRPRSKTMYVPTRHVTAAANTNPRGIPKQMTPPQSSEVGSVGTITSSYTVSENIDVQPSTSSHSQKSLRSNFVHSQSPTPSNSTTASSTSTTSTTTACRIDLINCDDIKIWTDQSQQLRQQEARSAETTAPFAIPQNPLLQRQVTTSMNSYFNLKDTIRSMVPCCTQKPKSVSPIGSFLCNLFSTPPTYTHWSTIHQNTNSANSQLPSSDNGELAAAQPCNASQAVVDLSSSGGVFDSFLPVCGKKLRSRNSQNLFEDGISTLDYSAVPSGATDKPTEAIEIAQQPSSEQPRLPKSHQSLTDFLHMSQLSRNNTELEKENAHFRISEAIITAIEHMKWANAEPEKRWRRSRRTTANGSTATATDWLASEQSADSIAKADAEATLDDFSEHIPYAELGESCLDLPSAEVVGLSLISKFNDKHLPKVSELKWLVSEEDAPQQLLPMPDDSPTANPDDNVIPPMTRGTKYWAPPRQQIIFTDHPPPNRRELIQRQNNRCAGCGMRVSRQYLHSFRYCTYLGKYHCTGCHRNQMSPIPARILHTWDFKCYPVSVFAYRLLEQMYTYPLFYVPDLNAALYVRSKALYVARKRRVQLKFVKGFIKTCRFAVREQVYFESIPHHITSDPDTWSLSDFVDVHNKSMQHSIEELIDKCEHHIFSCVLCTARGFLCEYCNKDQVIYPWESKVFRCERCGSCFHQCCWKSMLEMCCRCQRINKRQDELTEI